MLLLIGHRDSGGTGESAWTRGGRKLRIVVAES
jgi:hypothetical protein